MACDNKNHFESNNSPRVFKNMLSNGAWMSLSWDWKHLMQNCGEITLHFRIVSKLKKGPVWESDAQYIEATIKDFIDWINFDPLNPNEHVLKFNPFASYALDKYWIYSSYNSVNIKFPENNIFRKNLDWSVFGLSQSLDRDSSFWIGSGGAYTPCHVDTYGFNLVAQIIGRKRWVLFPPEDDGVMYPTRIPYEESSIFSSVDIMHPDLKHHPLFQNSHPYVIILNPGDVLLVPEKWWHFVECLDNSVSVNTWTPLPSDDHNRLKEAVTKVMFSALFSVGDPYKDHWINPAEDLIDVPEALKIVDLALSQLATKNTDDSELDCSASKMAKLSQSLIQSNESGQPVSAINFSTFLNEQCSNNQSFKEELVLKKSVDLKSLINCFLHPDVISCICTKIEALIKK